MNYKIYNNDCLKQLEDLEENSIDSIVTDPPYELNFMGKGWDNAGISFNKETWEKCLRVLKPGGYLLAFGGSRTYHRIAVAIEDAGFEIRDTIMWLYGSGFPKSMDISKQIDKRPNRSYENLNLFSKKLKEQRELKGYSKNDIDKMMGTNTAYAWWEGRNYLGEFKIQLPDKENYKKLKEILELNDDMDFIFEEAEREVIGTTITNKTIYQRIGDKNISGEIDITIPSTELAKKWQGWGTALKPSFEPIIVARKPFKGSLVDNVIQYGVGGINIDECRVEPTGEDIGRNNHINPYSSGRCMHISNTPALDSTGRYDGRFPANTILTYDESDFDEVCCGFPQSKGKGASRYFYCAKASKKDREEGLEYFEEKPRFQQGNYSQSPVCSVCGKTFNGTNDHSSCGENTMTYMSKEDNQVRKNIHPTVKPTELMQYLVRLVTPKDGIILDPFMGSGSTGKAVMYENKERNTNYKFIGIEREKEYCDIAEARIKYASKFEERN